MVLNVVVALCLVLASVLVIARIAGRSVLRRSEGDDPSTRIQVLSRAALAPKQGLALVEVGSDRFTVSYGEGGVRLLGRAPTGSVEAAGAGPFVDTTGEARGTLCTVPVHPPLDGGVAGIHSHTGSDVEPPFGDRLRLMVRRALAIAFLGLAGAGLAGSLQAQTAQAAQVSDPAGVEAAAPAAQEPADEGAPADGQVEGPAAPLGPDVLWDLMKAAGLQSEDDAGPKLPGPVGAVLFVGFLTLLPTLLLLMTSFTRILVVLNLLRQALGTQTAPPSHLLIALALLLTGFVMAPTLNEVNTVALAPWVAGETDEVQMLSAAAGPFREFMLSQVRDEDLAVFAELQVNPPASLDDVPLTVLTSAFVTSELRRAFQIGFAVFLPFVVIDVVVASVLMSMGMFMLPPVMVSLPFKLLLFVLVDGWALMLGGLARSFM